MKKIFTFVLAITLFSGLAFAAKAKISMNASDNIKASVKGINLTAPVQQRFYSSTADLALDAKSAYWLGDYRLAIELYHLLLNSGDSDCNDIYNLACCYSLLGEEKEAARYLCLSVNAGFKDLDHIMTDPDFEKVRETSCFQKALRKAGQEISKRQEVKENWPVIKVMSPDK